MAPALFAHPATPAAAVRGQFGQKIFDMLEPHFFASGR